MSAVQFFRGNVFGSEVLRRVFAWLILFCISLCLMPAFGQKSIASADLVYCPLQKNWVAKNSAPMPPIRAGKPLGEICSSERQKEVFFFDLSKNLNFRQIVFNQQNGEKLFFNYLEKGKQAFAEIAPSQNLPDRQLAKLASTEKSTGGNYRTDFIQTPSEVFALHQFPRPPTVHKVVSDNSFSFREIKTISRRIAPRAPPVRS